MLKTPYKIVLIVLIPALTMGLAMAVLTQTASDVSLSDWLTDSAGYQQAVAAQPRLAQPMLLFFHTEWCSSCKALKEQVLSRAEVQTALQDFIHVKINPEVSAGTRSIARRYGVTGYPTLVVIPSNGASAQYYFARQNISPSQFTADIRHLAALSRSGE